MRKIYFSLLFVLVLCFQAQASDLNDNLDSTKLDSGVNSQAAISDRFLDAATDIVALEAASLGAITATAGSESSNDVTITVSVLNPSGDLIAQDIAMTAWITDLTAGETSYTNMIAGVAGAPTTSTPTDFRVNPNTGTLLKEITTNALLYFSTGADGTASLVVNQSGAMNKYLCVEGDGKISTSLSISLT